MLRVWNVSLVLATGILAIMGTFLVRSGILESIHAFGASTLGIPFLALLGVLIVGSAALVVTRREGLRSEARLDSLFSREAAFLLNNLALVGLCFVIMWGTFFPLISELATGRRASVGAPWFDRYTVPLAIALVLLSGIGPTIAWRRATPRNLRRNFAFPLTAAGVGPRDRLDARRRAEGDGTGDVLRGGVRARSRRSGVLARRAGAPRRHRRAAGGRAGDARRPQPPPLRRLPGARRDGRPVPRGGRLVGLPGRTRRTPSAGSERAGRGLRHPLRQGNGRTETARSSRWERCYGSARTGTSWRPWRRAVATTRLQTRGSSDRSAATSKARRRVRWGSRQGPNGTSGRPWSPTSTHSRRWSTASTGVSRWRTRRRRGYCST